MQKVLAKLRPHEASNFLLDYFKNVLWTKESVFQPSISDLFFMSNDHFWSEFLRKSNPAFKSLKLEGFRIVNWFPRSPGLYHTKNALKIREKAQQFVNEQDRTIYEPAGKASMIEGGLGSVRFKPVTVGNQEYLLCTATSDDYCHSGIPLAIPASIVKEKEIDFDEYKLHYNIEGEVKFIPDILEPHFRHQARIPQIYILVKSLEKVSQNKSAKPITINPMVFFVQNESSRKEVCVTYVNCLANSTSDLDEAIDWISNYVKEYNGSVLTNFDQQRPAFEDVPFSLQKIMNSPLNTDILRQIEKGCIATIVNSTVNNIYTDGGNYIESLAGDYIE